jgi:hypothetical protein
MLLIHPRLDDASLWGTDYHISSAYLSLWSHTSPIRSILWLSSLLDYV